MSDFTAFYITTVVAIAYAPLYVVAALLVGLVWCFVSELP